MQISSLTDIVEGKLQNTPAISFITQIHTDISKINEGDAYLVLEETNIQKAVEKGAFAIIYQTNSFEPLDSEIAWIQVESIQKAISNVLRFRLLQLENKYIHVNKIFFKLLNIFKSKELGHILTLKNDISINFEKLYALEENKVIFSTDYHFLKSISGDVVSLQDTKYSLQNLTQHSLFETTFSYKERYFDKIKLPRVYIDYLLQQLELFEYKLDLKKLSQFDLFKPIFINKSAQIVPYGQTNRFVIANKDKDIAHLETEYLQNNYSYAKVIVIDGESLNENEILSLIQTKNFNALYFQGIDHTTVVDILQKNDQESSLINF